MALDLNGSRARIAAWAAVFIENSEAKSLSLKFSIASSVQFYFSSIFSTLLTCFFEILPEVCVIQTAVENVTQEIGTISSAGWHPKGTFHHITKRDKLCFGSKTPARNLLSFIAPQGTIAPDQNKKIKKTYDDNISARFRLKNVPFYFSRNF